MNPYNRTDAQQEAVMTTEERVLLVAGPGSGKTATTVGRIKKLIDDGVKPAEIAAITFTNSAANELETRLSRCFDRPVELGYVGTLHGFALMLLKEHGSVAGYGVATTVISPDSAKYLLESKARTLAIKTPMKKLLELKREGVGYFADKKGHLEHTAIGLYLDELRESRIVDFDVLLAECAELLREGKLEGIRDRFSYLFVDEVQDSGTLDWAIYRALPMRWKFYVGDPDQAIYGFRGGSVVEMINEAEEIGAYPIWLEANFRSESRICDAANALIARNLSRIPKRTISAKPDRGGEVRIELPFATAGAEIASVAAAILEFKKAAGAESSIAILSRTNAVADQFRRTLRSGGVIPVVDRQTEKLPKDWDRARGCVELMADPENDSLAFICMIAAMAADGIPAKKAIAIAHAAKVGAAEGKKTLASVAFKFPRVKTAIEAAVTLADLNVTHESRMIVSQKARELPRHATVADLVLALGTVFDYVDEGERHPGVVEVLTIHGAKGREFDAVFLVGNDVGESHTFSGPAELEEERRLVYVALTRARSYLHLSCAETRAASWNPREILRRKPTAFFAEMLADCSQ